MLGYCTALTEAVISIHTLLAESDRGGWATNHIMHISIHTLLAESDINTGTKYIINTISIHTLLAESDEYVFDTFTEARNFNPHSPRRE